MTHDQPLASLLPSGLLARLNAVSSRTDRTPEDCLIQAVSEYCDTWEDYHRMVDQVWLDEDERRTLRVVND